MPLLDGLVLGLVFALCLPAGAKSLRKAAQDGLPGSHNLHSCFPLSAIFASGAIEAISQMKWLQDQQGEILAAAYEFISRLHIPPIIFEELSRGMENLLAMDLHLLASLPLFRLGTAITMGLADSVISLCVFYFLLLDAERLAEAFMALQASKSRDFDRKCLEKIDGILSGIYMGSIYTAIAGGLTSAAIFYHLIHLQVGSVSYLKELTADAGGAGVHDAEFDSMLLNLAGIFSNPHNSFSFELPQKRIDRNWCQKGLI